MTTKADAEQRQREKALADMKMHERENDIVPGTSSHDGKVARGGTTWEGRARMALARQGAGLPLNADDREAVRRYPHPRSGITE